MDLVRMIKAIS